jgi:hypothetical protein
MAGNCKKKWVGGWVEAVLCIPYSNQNNQKFVVQIIFSKFSVSS